ncbi:translation initiation factor IF-3 [Cocleimonas sp. KMM 6892]|uniref:translation initiation factor IF-3 n=1 Tax=Cocleimonas TaxID=998014 RepID=UPI001051D619|nr:translation initiation factor IF-3 [Cocleimonas flava]MEB8433615.1 translation initiation factor IF-3 [Cocleimonas sp. KMM 6892]MEC4716426.1 translation initiation factor IF-3 [Cocleimonas sp. KMM 6895]MEC4745681.1 translation initiation factor IF-3 [Cocleimonas sp. KMM 6896]
MAKPKKNRVNEEINVPQVRLIDKDGENVGVVKTTEAMEKAAVDSLDLVEIVPTAEPPVCRIMDYGKFKFSQSKQKGANKKKQKKTQVKEIKMRPGTDIGDYNIKLKKLTEFLQEGDKTKVTIRFRGREMAHRELGMEMLKRVEKDLEEYGSVEQFPKMEGRQMIMVIGPIKKEKGQA